MNQRPAVSRRHFRWETHVRAARLPAGPLYGDPDVMEVARALMQEAAAVARAAGATYLDEVFAYIGAASAHAQLDDKPQTTLSIEAAVVRALDVGDVVAIALATNAYQHLIGRPHPAFDQPTQLEAGWLNVIDSLPAVASAHA